MINFQLTDYEIPEVDRKLLNKNQRYLDVNQAIKNKNFPNDLPKRGSGPFSWITWKIKSFDFT